MRRDWSVGRLLSRAFGALVLLILCSGVAEMTALLAQHRVVRQLTTHVQPLELANAQLRAQLADAQRGLRGYLITGDLPLLDAYLVAHGDYPIVIHKLRRLLLTEAERRAVRLQVTRADIWWELAERQRGAAPRSDNAARFVTRGKPLFDAFLAANAEFDRVLAARTTALTRQSTRLGVLSVVAVVALTLAGVLFAVLTARRMARLITRPLSALIGVLLRRHAGETELRADRWAGPSELRAAAEAVNTMADESERIRAAEQEAVRLRDSVLHLGYRIRGNLVVADAVREAAAGLHEILGADHVLVRVSPASESEPALLASLNDEHLDGPLTALAASDVSWLRDGDVSTTPDSPVRGNVPAPAAENAALALVGDGSVLTVSVSGGDEGVGALTLIRDHGPPWRPVEIRITEVVAADLGRGIHLARLYEREQSLVARLQEVDTAKTDFMSTVSHELRTPLTSIAGYLELLRDAGAGPLTDTQGAMLDVIGRNTRRLRELIEDMLVLSKIESGGFRSAKRAVDLVELIGSAVAAFRPAAAEGSVAVRSRVDGPLRMVADPGQIDRVLTNLLANAVKFTPPGGTVTASARIEDGELVLIVADTGMGIPKAEQPALFARFFRASNAIHRAIPGTGLGLAIVRTIVDNHGGRIAVDSAENAGTTITIRLPAEMEAETVPPASSVAGGTTFTRSTHTSAR